MNVYHGLKAPVQDGAELEEGQRFGIHLEEGLGTFPGSVFVDPNPPFPSVSINFQYIIDEY